VQVRCERGQSPAHSCSQRCSPADASVAAEYSLLMCLWKHCYLRSSLSLTYVSQGHLSCLLATLRKFLKSLIGSFNLPIFSWLLILQPFCSPHCKPGNTYTIGLTNKIIVLEHMKIPMRTFYGDACRAVLRERKL
jgi:hypothetical protein